MSGISLSLGTKTPSGVKHGAMAAKKPVSVSDLFAADSDSEEELGGPAKRQKTTPSVHRGAAVVPPADAEVRKVAEKLAEFVAKNGRSFEQVTKERNPGDTPFKFLFDVNSPEYKYYESKVKELEAQLGKGAPLGATPLPLPGVAQQPAFSAMLPSAAPSVNSKTPIDPGTISRAMTSVPLRSGGGSRSRWEDPEQAAARMALESGNSVAAMDAYMKLAEKKARERGRSGEREEEGEPEKRPEPLLKDTVFERRKVVAVFKEDGSRGHHMQDFIPPEELQAFLGKCGDTEAQLKAQELEQKNAIGADNIGHKLLQKMGWKEGQGIGTSGSGITAPVKATGIKQDNLGLGAQTVHDVQDGDDVYEQYRKRMMLGYKYRPNPLGNPRRQYY